MKSVNSLSKIAGLYVAALVLAGCTGAPTGVEPVTSFDIYRYQGTWYEIQRLDHRFERGLTNVTAEYALQVDGTVRVTNRGYNAEECNWMDAEGKARFLGDKKVASLAVSFFWPFSGGYHVFELDEEKYSYALVAGPSRKYLWLLARDPAIDPELEKVLVERARSLGFPTEDLIKVTHGEVGTTCET